MTDEQDKWFESLTGRQAIDDQDQEASCLRKALLKLNDTSENAPTAEIDSEQKLEELLDMLRNKGLLDDKSKHPFHRAGIRYAIAAALVIAVILPLAYFVLTPSGVDVEHRDITTTAKVKSQNTESIDKLDLARQMLEYGLNNQDALALVLSLNIYKSTTIEGFTSQVTQQTANIKTKSYAEYVDNIQSEILPRAKEYVRGDVTLLAMVDDIEAETMRGAGGKVYAGEVALERSRQIRFIFNGGELAVVYAEGIGEGDIDLIVYDEDGRIICADTDIRDAGLCKWLPEKSSVFVIEVNDTSPIEREFVLLTN